MTDALQLDFFKRARAPRVQKMTFRDAGWSGRGEEVCWFECPKCGATSGMKKWRHDEAQDGPPCPKCNKGKQ